MAAQERIIGGGFLIFGVAIVLILLYIFAWSGTGSQEAYDQITGELFPAYLESEDRGEYVEMKNHAQAILDMIEEGGATGVKKYIESNAAGGQKDARQLQKLVSKGVFEKNAEGLFDYKDDWYAEATHRALIQLEECVEERMKALRSLRRVARDARDAVDEARVGSKQELAFSAAKKLAEDDVPVMRPNPVYESDTELYRVFGLTEKALSDAIEVPNPGGKSTSARLRWNKNVAPSELGKNIENVPELARSLDSIATQIQTCAATLENDKDAAEAYARLLKQGAKMLGAGLDDANKAIFKENVAKFERSASLVQVLRKEARMLEPYLGTVRTLGSAFTKQFEK